jgi:hypothetical protein
MDEATAFRVIRRLQAKYERKIKGLGRQSRKYRQLRRMKDRRVEGKI